MTIRIQKLQQQNPGEAIEVTIKLEESEFKQLGGELNSLCTFSPHTLTVPVRVNKTGARNSAASWLLFPITLRRKYKTSNYNFDKVTCGTLDFKDNLFVVYKVPKKFVEIMGRGK